MKLIQRLTRIAILALTLLLALGAGAAFASTNSTNSTLYIADVKVDLNQSLWTVGGWTYAPVKELVALMGWTLEYDGESGRTTIRNDLGDALAFKAGSSDVALNGRTYDIGGTVRLKDGVTYAPLRVVAESMHASVGWKDQEKVAVLQQEALYTVVAGDTLWRIAEAHDTTATALKVRNGLASEALAVGQQLKVVAPEFLDPDVSEQKATAAAAEAIDPAELTLLAKLVEAEAGSEPYEGKLAVASVVMNRLHNDRYADTLRGVIYAPGQFSPAGNGSLERETPSKDSLKAAKAALSGENNVPGAYSFFNPQLEPAKAKRLKAIKKIGHHVFV
ncbi:Cell wall hydrolase CwlJ, involved in spore germination [Cohnella sp. OV330]|uniref:cell wall hydrolase n=1 Tax=Cohnella sp. OV330 TaxID=1855288 RepID=UPI0008F153A7|nr:cell wall hydrolase [Cohnella sp. OV330]SFB54169.1 Cell wall hydrolase CwlJ, involved in spore germination [Cohnella sp. OV330]